MAALLAVFAVVEALDVPFLTDAGARLDQAGPATAAAGVALLVVDVVLPVPSSVVMTVHGALFGVVAGTVLSLVGSAGAALAGYAIGRRGGPLLTRRVSRQERERADDLLERWGVVAVIATRPVPILAETTAMLAGASGIGAGRVVLAALAGSLPPALLYALAGSIAEGFASTLVVFGGVMALAGGAALIVRRGR